MIEARKARKGDPNGVAELMWWAAECGRLVDDPEALAQILEVQAELDRQVRAAARRLNGEGFSWAVLGRAVGVSDVAAMRWARAEGGRPGSRAGARP